MPAHLGNNYGLALKDPEVRQEAYRQYCKHLSEGWPKQAFFFKHPKHSVCYKTLDRYIRENPDEFPAILMEEAQAARFKYWLNEGKNLIQGVYPRGSPVVWQTVMRNIFRDIGWDQEKIDEKLENEREHFKEVIRLISAKQKEKEENTIQISPS